MENISNATTNSYILNSFNDIAYGVYVIDNDADLTAISDDVSDNGLRRPALRLRNAERRLRPSYLLSTIDLERGNLWLFLPNKELQENRQSILSETDGALRGAGCRPVVPFGSTIKVQKLWDEENARLKRLFVSAVAAMISRNLQESVSAIPLNARTFLISNVGIKSEAELPNIALSDADSQVCTINIDLYMDGLVWIATDTKPYSGVRQLSSLSSDKTTDLNLLGRDVWIAPLGRSARYIGPETSNSLPQSSSPRLAAPQSISARSGGSPYSAKIDIWKRSVCDWLTVLGLDTQNLLHKKWAMVEVWSKLRMDLSNGSGADVVHSQDQYRIEKILWPVSFCMTCEKIAPLKEADFDENSVQSDPLKWAEDWFNDTRSRLDAIGKRKAARIAKQLQQDQAKAKEIAAEEELGDTFSLFPRSNQDNAVISGIYPTPPDGALSQATPGPPFEPSMDSPEDTESRIPRERRGTIESQDQSMPMFDDGQENHNAATGPYDEDLFEDSGGADFTAGGIADEPDWDFFNEPDEGTAHDVDVSMEDAPEVVFARDADGKIKAENLGTNDAPDSEPPNGEDIVIGSSRSGYRHSELSNQRNLQKEIANQQAVSAGPEKTLSPAPIDVSKSTRHVSHTGSEPSGINASLKSDHYQDELLGSYKRVSSERTDDILDNKYGATGRFYFETKRDRDETQDIGYSIDSLPGKDATDPRSRLQHGHSYHSSMSSGFASDSEDSYPVPDLSTDDQPEGVTSEHLQQPILPDVEIDERDADQLTAESFDLLELLQTDVSEWPIDDILSRFIPHDHTEQNISDEDYLKVAHIAVDQETQTSFGGNQNLGFAYQPGVAQQTFFESMKKTVLGTSALSVQDLASSTEPVIRKVQSSRIQVKRDNESLQALSSILPFWEAFSLEPASGRKDVLVLCIYPDGVVSSDAADGYIQLNHRAKQIIKKKSHRRSMAPPVYSGLVPWSCQTSSKMQNLTRTCEAVGEALPSGVKPGTTFVIYIINPFPEQDMNAKFGICASFLRLFECYGKSRSSSSLQDVDLTLQIIPLTFVQSPNTIIIAQQGNHTRLAIEVYNRCPPTTRARDFAACSSAVTLAPETSKQLRFSLSDTVTSPLKSEEKLLHMAYCQTSDERWLVAAWSDQDGRLALTMSYCLRRRGSVACRQLSEVINAMWETSLDITRASEQARKYRWRLVVAKGCPVDPVELNEWNVLVQGQVMDDFPNISPVAMTHVTIATRPTLKLRAGSSNVSSLAQPTTIGVQNTPQQSNITTVSTPVSTPTNSQPVLSPEQIMFSAPTPASTGASLANAPTPPAAEHSFDMDVDSILINPSDESEYLLLPPLRTLNNSRSIVDYRPAKRSAYLFQRTSSSTTSAQHGWLGVSGVDINLIQRTPSYNLRNENEVDDKVTDEAALEELLSQYRALITLAKTRGMVPDPEREGVLLPWHLESAIRGCNVLCVFP